MPHTLHQRVLHQHVLNKHVVNKHVVNKHVVNKHVTPLLGAVTGLVGLLAMSRLITGAGLSSTFSWVFVLLAMLPWVAYCAYRAWHGHLDRTSAVTVVACCLVGVVGVWLFTFGPVLALACSLGAFTVIWVHDWPPRRERGEDQFVHIEELAADEPVG